MGQPQADQHFHIIGIPEGEEREEGAENSLEDIMAKNIPNLGKETDIQEV